MNKVLQQSVSQAYGTDASVLQREAAQPAASRWVGASAGSGKTKVLTDRILRLLLPQDKGVPGSAPHKILALTFTKAAASEMAARVRTRLSRWAIMTDEGLKEELSNLLGRAPRADDMTAARRLFAAVVDAPGGLPIMTIHAFCQSVLGRFPLEAGVAPDFTLIEDAAQAGLMREAKRACLERIHRIPASPAAMALGRLLPKVEEEALDGLIAAIRKEERQLDRLLEKTPSLYEAVCLSMNVSPGIEPHDRIAEFCADGRADTDALRQAAQRMAEYGTKTDRERAACILPWLAAGPVERVRLYKDYIRGFISKSTDAPYAALVTKKLGDAHPDIIETLGAEAAAIVALNDDIASIECCQATADLFTFARDMLDEYHRMKEVRGQLDFDDLIFKTLDLLEGRAGIKGAQAATSWVMYKLDRGIDHILVDEAQDTNPEQWDVIRALSSDFFTGEGAAERPRTLFVVGDAKQSIFSFQRAAPEKFHAMETYFARKITQAGGAFQSIPMSVSFRSARAVLTAVDEVFAAKELQQSLGGHIEPHKAHRAGQPGLVELWPLFETEKQDKDDYLSLPLTVSETQSGGAKLAQIIAATIKGWIGKELLPSHDRPVRASDIMVLVRTRNAFVGQLVRALKLAGVPVSGVDRMVLKDQIAVQDMLAAMRFALLPDDDLSLAELLKSPLVGWNDEDLLRIAPTRTGSLWQAVQNEPVEPFLSRLVRQAGYGGAYEFCAHILSSPCPADARSGLRAMKKRLGEEALDPLEELQNTALDFDQTDGRGLQMFLQQFEQGAGEVKRQMDESGDAVRIMTVHASKGLQAPIVFLPDTTRSNGGRQGDMLFWPERSGLAVPFFVPEKRLAVRAARQAKETYARLAEQEYARLLYVAMTRAEDRLYICGYKGARGIKEESWYNYIARAFDTLDGVERIGDIRRYSNPASAPPDRAATRERTQQNAAPLPGWLFAPAPADPAPPRPLIPSKPSESETDIASLSPLRALDQDRFKRGNITHKLLQILPDLPPPQREAAMRAYLALPAHGLADGMQQNIADEITAILTHPDFAPVFGAGSQAEVPVTGRLDDQTVISGQIDRLLVTEKEILIVDFKTNRPPPKDIKNVPAVYIRQMEAYKRALALIYPDRPIRAALLWTMEARLMDV